MSLNTTPFFPATLQAERCQLTNGSLGPTTAYTGATNGSKVVGLVATSTDTSAQTVTISLVHSATTYELGCVSILAGAGTGTTNQSQNLLASIPGLPIDNDGNSFIYMVTGDTLVATAGAVTSAKHINIHAFGVDF